MTFNPSDRTCFPADDAPTTPNKVAICNLCGAQSVLYGDLGGCPFCGASKNAMSIIREDPDFGGRLWDFER